MGQARHTEHVNVLVQCLYTLEPQRTRCRPPVFRGAGSRGTGITGESCWPRDRFLQPRQLDLQPGNQLRYVRQRTPVAMAVVDPQMPRPTLQKPRLLGRVQLWRWNALKRLIMGPGYYAVHKFILAIHTLPAYIVIYFRGSWQRT